MSCKITLALIVFILIKCIGPAEEVGEFLITHNKLYTRNFLNKYFIYE